MRRGNWFGTRAIPRLIPVLAILGFALLAPALSGCQSAPAAGGGGDAGKPIVVAATLSLTGAYAETAKQIKIGYELWADDVNKRGGMLGRKVELRIIDDEAKPDKAVQLLEKYLTVDKVDLLLGAYPATTISPQAPLAEKYKYVYIGMGAHGPSFQQGYQYFFGGPPLLSDWWPTSFLEWVKDLRQQPGVTDKPGSIAMLTQNNIIGQSTRTSALEYLKTSLPDVKLLVDELYDLPLTNADPLIAKAKQSGADIVMTNSSPAENTLFLRGLKVQGFQPKIYYGQVGLQSLDWVAQMGDLADNTFTGFTGDANTPKAKAVSELNQSKNGAPASLYILAGYNFGATLEAGVNGAKTLDNTKIRDWLKANEIDTPLGKLKFDAKGLPQPASYAYQAQGGKVVQVWPKGSGSVNAVYPMPKWK